MFHLNYDFNVLRKPLLVSGYLVQQNLLCIFREEIEIEIETCRSVVQEDDSYILASPTCVNELH